MGSRKSSSGQGSRPNRGNLGGVRGDRASTAAKIGLIATLLGALIAGTATVLDSLINKESNHTLPGAATMPQLAEEKTVTEQVHTSNPSRCAYFVRFSCFQGRRPTVWGESPPPSQQVNGLLNPRIKSPLL